MQPKKHLKWIKELESDGRMRPIDTIIAKSFITYW